MADRVAEDNGSSEALNFRGPIDRFPEAGAGTAVAGTGAGVCSVGAILKVAEAIRPRRYYKPSLRFAYGTTARKQNFENGGCDQRLKKVGLDKLFPVRSKLAWAHKRNSAGGGEEGERDEERE